MINSTSYSNRPLQFFTFSVLLVSIFTFVGFNYFNESSDRLVYEAVEDNQDWLKVRENVKINRNDVLHTYKKQLGLSDADELIHMRDDVDEYGNTHARYQHFHRGIKVEGSQLLIHLKNDLVYLTNGTLIRDLNVTHPQIITEQEAIAKAISLVPAKSYMWESEKAEELIKKFKKDPNATNYPMAEKVLMNPVYSRTSNNYRIAYDIKVHSMEPEQRERFFIDIENGEILLQLNLLHTGSSEGIAETKYHGTRTIITDSIAVDSFRLIDTVRNAGIYTYNAQGTTDLEFAVHFHDSDNYWNNVNAQKDEVATDVHYSAEMTFDYYALLGQDGLNGDDISFISLVHVNNNWTNATWNGMFARFGDASSPDSPLASLDVVGHEFTHGLTDFTADLVYMNEPGALNESFSDIFGTAIEFYGDPASGDYLIGEDFIADGGFRSMSDPNSFGDPDTYLGSMWQNGGGDNGGVHTNSGVQNYWFYLLAEGAIGVNDFGNEFEVEGIGINEAAKVAYGNLKNYLMVNSTYSDARLGGIQAAIDVFGECSNEVIQTTNAWYAVGVGNIFARTDFEILEITGPDLITCGVSSEEQVSILFRFNECDVTLPAGTIIPLSYMIDDGTLITEELTLSDVLLPGDSLAFTFSQPIAEFSAPGEYEITVSVNYPDDNSDYNNNLRVPYERIFAQNVDMAMNSIVSPFSSCYMAEEPIILALSYEGCDSIAAGEKMELMYRIDGGDWVSESYVLEDQLFRGDALEVTMNEEVDFTEMKEYIIDAMVVYELDTVFYNDLSSDNLVDNPDPLQYEVLMTFEGDPDAVKDSFYTINAGKMNITVEDSVGFLKTKGIKFTGSNVLPEIENGKAVLPTNDNVWNVNEDYKAQVCFCADLTNTDKARLKFRFTQTFSPIYEDLYGQSINEASSLRLLLNGQQFQNDYNPTNNDINPYFVRNLDITDYVGAPIEICFEASTLISAEFDPYEIGDNVHIDEVILLAEEVVEVVEISNEDNIKVYPNPTYNQLNIEFDPSEYQFSEINLMDINGKYYNQSNDMLKSGSINIDISEIPSGVYLLRMVDKGSIKTTKIVKL